MNSIVFLTTAALAGTCPQSYQHLVRLNLLREHSQACSLSEITCGYHPVECCGETLHSTEATCQLDQNNVPYWEEAHAVCPEQCPRPPRVTERGGRSAGDCPGSYPSNPQYCCGDFAGFSTYDVCKLEGGLEVWDQMHAQITCDCDRGARGVTRGERSRWGWENTSDSNREESQTNTQANNNDWANHGIFGSDWGSETSSSSDHKHRAESENSRDWANGGIWGTDRGSESSSNQEATHNTENSSSKNWGNRGIFGGGWGSETSSSSDRKHRAESENSRDWANAGVWGTDWGSESSSNQEATHSTENSSSKDWGNAGIFGGNWGSTTTDSKTHDHESRDESSSSTHSVKPWGSSHSSQSSSSSSKTSSSSTSTTSTSGGWGIGRRLDLAESNPDHLIAPVTTAGL